MNESARFHLSPSISRVSPNQTPRARGSILILSQNRKSLSVPGLDAFSAFRLSGSPNLRPGQVGNRILASSVDPLLVDELPTLLECPKCASIVRLLPF